ncbi:DNA repair protein RecO [Tetragenococcus solitarius]|uniref:DNA repair protein RecO n=1 Tax=Tetragenococcus solitarius TaxID=71453 RepID=A0ABN3YD67_9ENTE|nr:DNA repair protein RecO [Tetragenococcus solitarius]
MNQAESKGIILFRKDHKEKDMLVKIFTESSGKLMFYVKGAHRKNNPLAPAILPYTQATYIGKFNESGLSFLNSAKFIHPFTHIQADIFTAGYATYIMNLADAAIEDKIYDPHLYTFLFQALEMLDQGIDGEILTNIFEVQILQRFGVAINWQECAICGKTQGKFDFSPKYNGILCQNHWERDLRRYHADPRAIHFIRLFAQISYDNIHSIELKKETKQSIRQIIDQIYEEYVGLNLKSKKFIDQMQKWGDVLKPR